MNLKASEVSPRISIVVPVFNEEENIRPFLKRVVPVVEKIGPYEIIFCIDPSTDKTMQLIEEESNCNPNIGYLLFSRRFGQPVATIAGIRHARGESCVVIDVDLQDPPEIILQLYSKMSEGFDVVCAKRRGRTGETYLKRLISFLGYKIINKISNVDIPRNTGDFRIINRRVIESLKQFKESSAFLRGLVAYVGFRQTSVEYERNKRFAGRGNYNRYLGSLKIGFNGLVGFSNFLLSAVFLSGIIVSLFSVLVILFILISRFAFNTHYPLGTPTIVSLVLFMGGVQLISIGVLGEYIGRIYDEVKERPPYIIQHSKNICTYSADASSLNAPSLHESSPRKRGSIQAQEVLDSRFRGNDLGSGN